MKVVIQFNAREEEKALAVLLRHSPGIVLPNRIYVISHEAANALRQQGIDFTELSRDGDAPDLQGALSGERI